MLHVLRYKEIYSRAMSRAGKLLGANYKFDVLDNQLVIFLLRNVTIRCQLTHKFVWRRH